jgi:signal transduction histidine kinase/CheY-like chemotaxis protein/HPt (histidine-containing phosphotransfer) domain-containing protein
MESTAGKYKSFISVFSISSSIVIIVTGALVLLGWTLNNDYLKSMVPGLHPMHPVSAFNFILLGIALVIFNSKIKLEGKFSVAAVLCVISFLVIFVGINRLSAYISGSPTLIDEWIFIKNGLDPAYISHQSWMAPYTAFMFILTGMGTLILTIEKGRYSLFVQMLFLICSFISLFAIFGYVSTSSSALYQIKTYNPVALHTAFAFFMLSLAFISLHTEKGFLTVMTSEHLGGRVFRRLILFSVVIPFLLGWGRALLMESNLMHPDLSFSIIIVSLIIILTFIVWVTSVRIDEIDIERNRVEGELKKAVIIAEDAKKAQQRFLASMSHEIRTPLNAIIGFSEVLQQQHLDPELQKEYMKHISSAGGMLLNLIGDILDFNKIEEGKILITKESFHLREVISSALNPYKFTANEKGLDFSLEFDQYLPDYVIGDSEKIIQILVNLIGNAFKFTEKGKVSVSISNAGGSGSGEVHVLLLVSDTGMGIPAGKHKEIFESFTQGDNSISRRFGGSGLGLSIVMELVKAMGGEIQVCSPVPNGLGAGAGSTFWFALKLKVDNTHENNYPEHIDKRLSKFPREVKVLIAEDNEMNQKLASVIMANIGCVPTFVTNGKEAVKLLKQKNDFDIILMDVNMPVMNGYEAARIIRKELKSKVPMVGLTANIYKEDIENCLKAGMTDHLGKPYKQKQIFNMIDKCCFNSQYSIKEKGKYVDLKAIKKLINNDNEMLKELIIAFIEQKEDFIPKIEISLNNKDWKNVKLLSHNLKSSVKIMGIDSLLPQLELLEKKAGNFQESDHIPELIVEIKAVLNQSVIELEQELMKL